MHFFTTWLGRQRSKRDCNVQDHKNNFSQKKKKGGLNETLVTLPLCVLSSTCGSSDDVQKLWRFANIIENRTEEQINGILRRKHHFTGTSEKPNEDTITEDSLNIEETNPRYLLSDRHYQQSSPQCRHRRVQHIDEELAEQTTSESEESTTHHSQGCEFHETSSETNNEKTNSGELESTVHYMNKKMEILETKMDKILALLEQQDSQRKT